VKAREQLVNTISKQKSELENLKQMQVKQELRCTQKVDHVKSALSDLTKVNKQLKDQMQCMRREKEQTHKTCMQLKSKDAYTTAEQKKKDLELTKLTEKLRKLINEKEHLNKNNSKATEYTECIDWKTVCSDLCNYSLDNYRRNLEQLSAENIQLKSNLFDLNTEMDNILENRKQNL